MRHRLTAMSRCSARTIAGARGSSPKRARRFEQLEARRVFAGLDFVSVEAFGDGTTAASVLGVVLDQAGNEYRHGYFAGSIDLDPANTHANDADIVASVGPGRDLFLAKYDGQGSFLWARRLGSSATTIGQEESINHIAVDSGGNVYLTGRFRDTFQVDSFELASAGEFDGFLVKLDPNGSATWATRWGSELIEKGDQLALGSGGQVYVSGTKDNDTSTPVGSVSIMAFSSAGGALIWSKLIDSGSSPAMVAVDPSGNLNIGGFHFAPFDADPGAGETILDFGAATTNAYASTYVIQLDSTGEFRWGRTFEALTPIDSNSLSYAFGYRMFVDSNASILVSGTHGGRIDFDPGPGSAEIGTEASAFVVKLDQDGNFVWARGANGSANFFIRDIAVDGANNVLIAGYLLGYGEPINFDPGTLNGILFPLNSSTSGFDSFAWSLTESGEFRALTHIASANAAMQTVSMAMDSANNVTLVGSFIGTVDFDPGIGVHELTTVERSGFRLSLAAQSGITINRRLGHTTSEAGQSTSFNIYLDSPPQADVTIALASSDNSEGTVSPASLIFTPSNWSVPQTATVSGVDDAIYDGDVAYTIVLGPAVSSDSAYNGLHVASVPVVNEDDDPPPTKFYVVNDATQNRTYEYGPTGSLVESYNLNSGNGAPRGAATTAAGDKVWVVDANKKVYVYDNSGALLGSWTAGSLASNATVEGMATNGTDIWIVDARQDEVYRYVGAASRISGSQNATSSFSLNKSNKNPKDIVTDGTYLWVVDDSTTDKVFKYTLTGLLVGSWTISSGGGSPTGITIDPANVSDIWIVDNSSDRVYQFTAAASRTSGSQSPATSFALAAGNTNPQGIADPPAPSSSGIRQNSGALSRFPKSGDLGDTIPVVDRSGGHRRVPTDARLSAVDFIIATEGQAVSRRSHRVGYALDAWLATRPGAPRCPLD